MRLKWPLNIICAICIDCWILWRTTEKNHTSIATNARMSRNQPISKKSMHHTENRRGLFANTDRVFMWLNRISALCGLFSWSPYWCGRYPLCLSLNVSIRNDWIGHTHTSMWSIESQPSSNRFFPFSLSQTARRFVFFSNFSTNKFMQHCTNSKIVHFLLHRMQTAGRAI